MKAHQLHLRGGAYTLALSPLDGGAIDSFTWGDEPLLRARCGAGPLNAACFPLVPFSNRIAYGRFGWDNREVALPPNFPGRPNDPHTLHGFGWLNAWEVLAYGDASAILSYQHHAGDWPWSFRAEQRFELTERGLRHALSITNTGVAPMPAGLGFHPYFPCAEQTIYRGLHEGEWLTDFEGLPLTLQRNPQVCDWWNGKPITGRNVDTVYVGRRGSLRVVWPERSLSLVLSPSPQLRCTVVYVPRNSSFFCIEPVTHETDALNRPAHSFGMKRIGPGKSFAVSLRYRATSVRG